MLLATLFVLSPIVLTIGLLWQKWRFWKRQGIPTDWSARSGQPFHISDNECHRKHGKVVGFYEGLRPCLSVTDPNLIRKVLVTDFHKFANHRELPAESEPIGKGVFFTPYPQWKRIRALHSTAFTTGRLKAMLPIMSDTFDRLVTLLDPKARDSQVVDFRTVYDSFTFDVITRAVAGADTNALGYPGHNPLLKAIQLIFQADLGLNQILVFFMPFLRRFFVLPFFDGNAMRVIGDTVNHVIKDRVARDVQVPDLLQHSVNASVWADRYRNPPVDANKAFDKLTEVEVLGMSMSMLGAGYETTASQLCYITRILALKPWYQTKLVHEIHNTLYTTDTNELSMDYEKLQKMPFLDAFIKEVMRVNCSVTRVDRIVTNDTYLEGIYLPKDTPIIIPIWALHIDPDHFPEPMEFKPERFLPDNIDTIKPYTYLPFATGPRNCIGYRFAVLELKYTLVKLLCRASAGHSIDESSRRELPADCEPIGKGVFFTPYPQWKRIRALHSTAFTTGRLKAMLPIMSDTFERLVTLLDPKARDSQVVDFRTVYDSFTFDVITRAVAGADTNALGHPGHNSLLKAIQLIFQADLGLTQALQIISDTVNHVIRDRVARDEQVPDLLQHSVNASVWADRYPNPPVDANKAFDSIVDRIVTNDTYLEGIYLPKDTHIIISIWALHIDPDHFSEFMEFKPERFLPDNIDIIKPYTCTGGLCQSGVSSSAQANQAFMPTKD
ncbi:unnamed protein product [Medioppia subpectinata]|uniref:Cytochrome P450 n=1 Tax=Medioppia subpectinata TaxID=1979941 RepID=A0A7R9KK73_9ACAR|nr:unnamed protein product [Medioppia subpectinata]CAG2105097.1 unnamed protein product [Medioppia subpectinata]